MIALRIGFPATDEEYRRTVDEISRHAGCCDEIWSGPAYLYGLDFHKKNAPRFAAFAAEVRRHGMRFVLEFPTLGHAESRAKESVAADDFEKQAGLTGYEADGAYCPWGGHIRSYYASLATLYAKAVQPDVFYLDDDLRLDFRNKVEYGCFCDACIRRFNDENHLSMTREEIAMALKNDRSLRLRYIDMNRRGLSGYVQTIAKAAHAVSEKTVMGIEYACLTKWCGGDYEHLLYPASRGGKAPVYTRPGCFFYHDHAPREMLDKVLIISYQNAIAPPYVTLSRPEIDNCCHTLLGKSPYGTAVEATMNLLYGCTGLSFCLSACCSETPGEYAPYYEMLSSFRPYWETLLAACRGTKVGGVYLANDRRSFETVIPDDDGEDWQQPGLCEAGRKLIEIGLPVSYEKAACRVTILDADTAKGMTDDAVKELLRSDVITDGETIRVLQERGYGAYLPVEVLPADTAWEVYAEHPLCGELAGKVGFCDGFDPAASNMAFRGGEPLSYAYDNDHLHGPHADMGTVRSTLLKTTSGGRWALIGSGLFCTLVNGPRRAFLLHAASYLSGGLPACLVEERQAAVIPRVDQEGNCRVCGILPLSIGKSDRMTVIMKTTADTVILHRPMKQAVPLPVTRQDETHLSVTLPPLDGWEPVFLTAE